MKGKWLIASGLVLVELLLCAGIVAAVWMGMTRLGALQIRLGDFVQETVKATADEEQRFNVSGPATVNVNKGDLPAFGDVTVVTGSEDEVVVTARKTAWGVDEASAQAALDALKVVIDQRGDTISVSVDRPEEVFSFGNARPDRVDFTITVPAEASVYAVTDFGDLSVSGTSGDVHLDTDFGKVSVDGVASETVDVHSSFGEINLENIEAQDVTVRGNAGEIVLQGVNATGAMELDTDFGPVTFGTGSAESLDAQTNSGNVKLENLTIEEMVTAKSDFGGVTLTAVSAGSYDVSSNSGTITIDGASGSVKAHTDFGDVSVTGAQEVNIDLSTNSGSIEFAGTLGGGPHTIQTDFGSIRMSLPDDSELAVELQTDLGRIQSDLPITLTGSQENDHWTGTVNGGGASLTAETNSGDITIEILK